MNPSTCFDEHEAELRTAADSIQEQAAPSPAKPRVVLLVPVYNEEEVLPLLYARIVSVVTSLDDYAWEFLFVNDGSTDDSLSVLRALRATDERVSFVDLSRNFGKETAMLAGFDYFDGEAMIILDADLQDPPELIPEMLKLWREGNDDVFARRRSREGESFAKKLTSTWFYRLLQRSTRIPIQRDTGDFRLLDARCVRAIRRMRESERYTKGFFSWIGYSKVEIAFDRAPRAAGTTKWNYPRLIGLAIDGITSFTTSPLRFASAAGALVSLAAFVFMLITIVRTIAFGADVAGYPSLLTVILFLGGLQLISIGLIGEYLGRVFNETKRRPAYLISEVNGVRELNKDW